MEFTTTERAHFINLAGEAYFAAGRIAPHLQQELGEIHEEAILNQLPLSPSAMWQILTEMRAEMGIPPLTSQR
jgi:hypothetical protein